MYGTKKSCTAVGDVTHSEGAVLQQAAEVIAYGVGSAPGAAGRIQAPFGVHLGKLDENGVRCYGGRSERRKLKTE